MATIWFMIVAVMVALYVVLDGFDLGAGAVHLFIAKDDNERRTVIRAIGPVWDGNEVWLLAAGGTLYFAFPLLYASGFSGFYLPLMMVLWLLMLRAIGIEFRTHIQERVWKGFFDTIFGVSSILLAIFFGAALGNVVRGVPLNPDGYFFEPLWTNWRVGAAERHSRLVYGDVRRGGAGDAGGARLTLSGNQDGRGVELPCSQSSVGFWPVQVLLTIFSLIATVFAVPHILENYTRWPVGFLVPVVVVGSLGYMYFAHSRRHEKGAFLASCTYIIAMLVGAVFALYPRVLPASTGDDRSLTIYNSAAGAHGLSVGFVWWTIGMILAAGYFIFVYRMFRGKVKLDEGSEHGY